MCRWQNESDKAMSVTHKHVGRSYQLMGFRQLIQS